MPRRISKDDALVRVEAERREVGSECAMCSIVPPSSGTSQRRPSSGTSQRRPSSGTSQRRPSSGTSQRRRQGLPSVAEGALIVGPVLERTPHAVALFTRYPVRWGHVLVVLRTHVTRFSDVSKDAWTDATLLARRAACALEHALDPVRCYVASLGAPEAELWVTSPHLHLHVVPVYDRDDRPRGVLTWEHGVYEADAEEWTELERRVRAAW